MKSIVEFKLEEGDVILVEVDEGRGRVRSSRSSSLVKRAKYSFDQALDRIKPAANVLIKKIQELHKEPDEIIVEFGLKLSAESGAVVAVAGVEANYKITLKWKKNQES